MPKRSAVLTLFALLFIIAVYGVYSSGLFSSGDKLTYAELVKKIKTEPKTVKSVGMTNGKSDLKVILAEGDKRKTVMVKAPKEAKEYLLKILDQAGIPVSVEPVNDSGLWYSIEFSGKAED